MSTTADLIRRQRALEKTLAKYRGKPFAWGVTDCVTLARSHLVAMGHKSLPKLPRYRDAMGAKRALKALGHDTLEGLLDGLLERIAPAEARPGDIIAMKGEAGLHSLTVSVGVKVMGWHQDSETFTPHTPRQIEGAWRA